MQCVQRPQWKPPRPLLSGSLPAPPDLSRCPQPPLAFCTSLLLRAPLSAPIACRRRTSASGPQRNVQVSLVEACLGALPRRPHGGCAGRVRASAAGRPRPRLIWKSSRPVRTVWDYRHEPRTPTDIAFTLVAILLRILGLLARSSTSSTQPYLNLVAEWPVVSPICAAHRDVMLVGALDVCARVPCWNRAEPAAQTRRPEANCGCDS